MGNVIKTDIGAISPPQHFLILRLVRFAVQVFALFSHPHKGVSSFVRFFLSGAKNVKFFMLLQLEPLKSIKDQFNGEKARNPYQ